MALWRAASEHRYLDWQTSCGLPAYKFASYIYNHDLHSYIVNSLPVIVLVPTL